MEEVYNQLLDEKSFGDKANELMQRTYEMLNPGIQRNCFLLYENILDCGVNGGIIQCPLHDMPYVKGLINDVLVQYINKVPINNSINRVFQLKAIRMRVYSDFELLDNYLYLRSGTSLQYYQMLDKKSKRAKVLMDLMNRISAIHVCIYDDVVLTSKQDIKVKNVTQDYERKVMNIVYGKSQKYKDILHRIDVMYLTSIWNSEFKDIYVWDARNLQIHNFLHKDEISNLTKVEYLPKLMGRAFTNRTSMCMINLPEDKIEIVRQLAHRQGMSIIYPQLIATLIDSYPRVKGILRVNDDAYHEMTRLQSLTDDMPNESLFSIPQLYHITKMDMKHQRSEISLSLVRFISSVTGVRYVPESTITKYDEYTAKIRPLDVIGAMNSSTFTLFGTMSYKIPIIPNAEMHKANFGHMARGTGFNIAAKMVSHYNESHIVGVEDESFDDIIDSNIARYTLYTSMLNKPQTSDDKGVTCDDNNDEIINLRDYVNMLVLNKFAIYQTDIREDDDILKQLSNAVEANEKLVISRATSSKIMGVRPMRISIDTGTHTNDWRSIFSRQFLKCACGDCNVNSYIAESDTQYRISILKPYCSIIYDDHESVEFNARKDTTETDYSMMNMFAVNKPLTSYDIARIPKNDVLISTFAISNSLNDRDVVLQNEQRSLNYYALPTTTLKLYEKYLAKRLGISFNADGTVIYENNYSDNTFSYKELSKSGYTMYDLRDLHYLWPKVRLPLFGESYIYLQWVIVLSSNKSNVPVLRFITSKLQDAINSPFLFRKSGFMIYKDIFGYGNMWSQDLRLYYLSVRYPEGEIKGGFNTTFHIENVEFEISGHLINYIFTNLYRVLDIRNYMQMVIYNLRIVDKIKPSKLLENALIVERDIGKKWHNLGSYRLTLEYIETLPMTEEIMYIISSLLWCARKGM